MQQSAGFYLQKVVNAFDSCIPELHFFVTLSAPASLLVPQLFVVLAPGFFVLLASFEGQDVAVSYASRIALDATVAENLDGPELPDTSFVAPCCYNEAPKTWASLEYA